MTVAYKSRCKRGQMIDRDIPLIPSLLLTCSPHSNNLPKNWNAISPTSIPPSPKGGSTTCAQCLAKGERLSRS